MRRISGEVTLPEDCVWWSGDRAEQRFLATWTGELAHPAVVEMRKELR